MKKRKDDREYTKKDFFHLKRKLLSAFTMFLVATILVTSTSYAWLVLSVAPEVSGITTNIGANGSLEIALLTTETRADLSKIRTAVGESLAQNNHAANNTWGNLVDLSYTDYGLGELALMPARINIAPASEGYFVDTNILSVPSYGFDGRIIELDDGTMSALYNNNEFSLVVGAQDYGVRAIGTTDVLSVQASALALAKANITAYHNSARSSVNSILGNHGDTLFNIVLYHSMDSGHTYGETELNALKSMLESTDGVADYIDRAIRQGIVAYAASEIGSKTTFTEVRDRVMDSSKSLTEILGNISEVGTVPAEFATWVEEYSKIENNIAAATNASNELTGGVYTWEDFRGVLDFMMNVDYVYINDTLFKDFDTSSAGDLIGGNVELTLAPGSGVFADIADFIDNFSSVMTVMGTNIEIGTVTAVKPAYLEALAAKVKDLQPADGAADGTAEAVALTNTYGYAIDLAFRCNAAVSDLLLQTAPEHRVYDGSETGSAMGGGSYMEFSTNDNTFALDKMILLMDAVRVAFIDDKNEVLGIAKLNTSNRSVVDGGVKASLYLYDYTLSEEDGSILMGERRKNENTITALEQNTAKAITAVVWLDGDVVDNTMVSATESTSLNGILNLQFSSSANLIPASNNELLHITADKTELDGALAEYTAAEGKITMGQLNYTTVSWEAFTEAYYYAVAVSQNPNATDSQVYFAALALKEAETALEVISTSAVNAKIDEVRGIMGTSGDIARYVIENEDGSYSAVGDEEHTQETHDSWKIVGEVYQVNYENNLHDEGNDIFTQIYTEESWVALADALYDAEAAVKNAALTDAQLNSVLTALEDAHEDLQRKVFFTPYEYNGALYYEAICDAADADTYGKWYDSDFKRVVADITILNLDAYAEPAEIFELEQSDYVQWNTEKLTPYVEVFDDIYPELVGEDIIGMHWNISDSEYYTELINQRHISVLNDLIGVVESEQLTVDTSKAEEIIENWEKPGEEARTVTAAEAITVIAELSEATAEALEAKLAEEAAADPSATDNQIILLNAAVTAAKGVAGYEDTENADFNNLRTAVQIVEGLLANESMTKDEANLALEGINAQLVAVKAKEVTEYNTLTHSIPVISEIYDLVFAVDYPGMILGLSGKTGTIDLEAVILTENGIVGKVSKIVKIYTPFDHIEFSADGWFHKPHFEVKNFAIDEGSSKDVQVEAYYCVSGESGDEACRDTLEKETELKNIEEGVVKFPEVIKTYTWASSNTDVVTVTAGEEGECVVHAKESGHAYISVSIETVEGNIYTDSFPVLVR